MTPHFDERNDAMTVPERPAVARSATKRDSESVRLFKRLIAESRAIRIARKAARR